MPAAAALLLQLWFFASKHLRDCIKFDMDNIRWTMNELLTALVLILRYSVKGGWGQAAAKGVVKRRRKKLTTKTQGILFQFMKHNYKLQRDLPTHPVLWGFHFQTWRWNSVPGSFSGFFNNMTSLIEVSASFYLKKSQLENCELKKIMNEKKKNNADTK